ncbi:MAG: BrnA antitoxin family protein [Mogibacterium sp.]|nr:BrnA antitoxin family protein [Mogibacterium sp.]
MADKNDVLDKEFDFSKAKKNPYTKMLKKQITININTSTIDYFKTESERTGIPYQTLINLYLTDCAENDRHLNFSWK